MTKYISGTLSIFLILFLFISCSDNSSGPGDDSSGPGGSTSGDQFPSKVKGVWQDDAETQSGDEIGIYFTDDVMGAWDYFGDSFDQGDDCYVAQDLFPLVSFSGDEYILDVQGDEVPVTIIVNGNSLSFDAAGDDEESYSKDSRSIGDLSPSCTGNKISTEKKSKIIKLLKSGSL